MNCAQNPADVLAVAVDKASGDVLLDVERREGDEMFREPLRFGRKTAERLVKHLADLLAGDAVIVVLRQDGDAPPPSDESGAS